MTAVERKSDFNSRQTPHTSPSRASYGVHIYCEDLWKENWLRYNGTTLYVELFIWFYRHIKVCMTNSIYVLPRWMTIYVYVRIQMGQARWFYVMHYISTLHYTIITISECSSLHMCVFLKVKTTTRKFVALIARYHDTRGMKTILAHISGNIIFLNDAFFDKIHGRYLSNSNGPLKKWHVWISQETIFTCTVPFTY